MNEREKTEIEQMLSEYLDGCLSQRQQTELKRLMEHQPQLKEQLRLLENQRILLQNLRVEKAPPGLAEQIHASLQRRLLLESSRWPGTETRPQKMMAVRKIVSAAALVLIPLAMLAAVMITILQPFGAEPNDGQSENVRVAAKIVRPDKDNPDEPADIMPEPSMEAKLTLTSSQPVATNDYIGKRIYSSGLLGYTILKRDADVTTYTVVCSAEQMQDFVGQLQGLLPHCEISALTVAEKDGKTTKIDNVSADQIQPLLETADPQKRERLANEFAQQNREKTGQPNQDTAAPAISSKPVQAWDDGQAKNNKPAGLTVKFVLEVRGK